MRGCCVVSEKEKKRKCSCILNVLTHFTACQTCDLSYSENKPSHFHVDVCTFGCPYMLYARARTRTRAHTHGLKAVAVAVKPAII